MCFFIIPPLDYIIFLYFTYMQNFKMTKDQNNYFTYKMYNFKVG